MASRLSRPLAGFGLFAVVSVLVTTITWNTLARPVDGDTHTYRATFTDVLGLRQGDDIRMAGVRVGKVTRIALDKHNNAEVTFIVQRRQSLYGNTKALVRYQNLIGQRYIALAPGTIGEATPLTNGAAIPLERTEPSFDVSALLNGFQPVFDVLRPEQVNNLAETIIQALQGDRVSLSNLIVQAAALGEDFRRRDAILTEVITNLSATMQGLARRGDELETLVTQTRALISGLYEQGRGLEQSTLRIATTTGALVHTIDTIQPRLVEAQDATREVFTLLLANGAKLDQAAIDVPAIAAGFGKSAAEGSVVSAYMCRLDVSLYGILFPRGLFPRIGGNAQSAVCRPS